MRDGFVDESAGDAFRFVFEFVVVEGPCQEALTRQCDRNTASVNSYPASTPLLCDVSGGAAYRRSDRERDRRDLWSLGGNVGWLLDLFGRRIDFATILDRLYLSN